MAKFVYIGATSARRVSSLYIGISGSARRITKAYVGVSGSAKQFWPRSYKWARYSVNTETRYRETRDGTSRFYNSSGSAYPYMPPAYASYSFNDSTGAFSLTGSQVSVTFRTGRVNYDAYCQYNNRLYHLSYTNCSSISGMGQTTRTVEYYGEYMYAIQYQVTSQGSFIDYVYADSRNTYPDNAQSGSYWYVFQE